jgi:hypothetical protein
VSGAGSGSFLRETVGVSKLALATGALPQTPGTIPNGNILYHDANPQFAYRNATTGVLVGPTTGFGSIERPGLCAPSDGLSTYFVSLDFSLVGGQPPQFFDTVNVTRVTTSQLVISGAGDVTSFANNVTIPPKENLRADGANAASQGMFTVAGNLSNLLINAPGARSARCVLQCGSLWCAFGDTIRGVPSSVVKWTVRWYEFRVSTSAPTTLRQTGVLELPGNASVIYPAIDVNVRGEVMISVMGFGPGLPMQFLHYGRLPGDPLNTTRAAVASFQAVNPFLVVGTGAAVSGSLITVRANDYTSLDVDSADGATFYFISECFRQTAANIAANTPTPWESCLVKARFENVPSWQ